MIVSFSRFVTIYERQTNRRHLIAIAELCNTTATFGYKSVQWRCSHTKNHLSRRLRRQPEDDECKERQEKARNDKDVRVESRHSFDLHVEREVRVRFRTTWLVPHVSKRWMLDHTPLVALQVFGQVYLPNRITSVIFTVQNVNITQCRWYKCTVILQLQLISYLLHKRVVIISNFTKSTTLAGLKQFSFHSVSLMCGTNCPKQLIVAHYRIVRCT